MVDRDRTLNELSKTPMRLREALDQFAPEQQAVSPDADTFALVEQFWHMADLESEAYGVRIERLLAEERPHLPDFDGAKIARERAYKTRDATRGLAAFARARRENLAHLASLTDAQWKRRGTQDDVGEVTLDDVVRMMQDHDREHLAEIAQLLSLLSSPS